MEQIPEDVLRDYSTLYMTCAVSILFTSDRHAPFTRARLETPLQIAEESWQREGIRTESVRCWPSAPWWPGCREIFVVHFPWQDRRSSCCQRVRYSGAASVCSLQAERSCFQGD